MDQVILVDRKNRKIGTEEKMKAHKEGKLHRAFSVFVFNLKNELLLQQRALDKYHSGGLWSNTCCSHPGPEENILQSAHRRLKEEMGFDCKLKSAGYFLYEKEFSNGLAEREYDCILIGKDYNGEININKKEVENYRWAKLDEIKKDIKNHPNHYTYWFKEILDKYYNNIF